MSLSDLEKHFTELEAIIVDTESRITGDPPDEYLLQHANFLTKSFLISLCCYLEISLKEIARAHVESVKHRLLAANIPHNILAWALNREIKDKDMKQGAFALPITAKEIDDELSGNPFRTAKCFSKLGIDLEVVSGFTENKDLVNQVVSKRNNIIHHNDSATDISLGDVRVYSGHFRIYVRAIAEVVLNV